MIGLLALVSAAIFGGAAIYISVAEQPARMRLDEEAMLIQWKLAYARGYAMQASLAVIATLLGCMAWRQDPHAQWLIGTGLMFANWPFTLFVIMRINRQLLTAPTGEGGIRPLMRIWGRLHEVRSMLGAAGTIAFLVAQSRA